MLHHTFLLWLALEIFVGFGSSSRWGQAILTADGPNQGLTEFVAPDRRRLIALTEARKKLEELNALGVRSIKHGAAGQIPNWARAIGQQVSASWQDQEHRTHNLVRELIASKR